MAISSIWFPMLIADNFTNWKFIIHIVFEKKRCRWSINYNRWRYCKIVKLCLNYISRKVAKEECAILQSVPNKYLEYIQKARSAKEMIESLINISQNYTKQSQIVCNERVAKNEIHWRWTTGSFQSVWKVHKRILDFGRLCNGWHWKVCYLLLTMSETFENVITSIKQ